MTIDRPLGKGEGESNHVSCLFQHPEVHGVCAVGGSRDTGIPTHVALRVVATDAGHCGACICISTLIREGLAKSFLKSISLIEPGNVHL